jgi:hypothetical protein
MAVTDRSFPQRAEHYSLPILRFARYRDVTAPRRASQKRANHAPDSAATNSNPMASQYGPHG